jgi:hypothetical protein
MEYGSKPWSGTLRLVETWMSYLIWGYTGLLLSFPAYYLNRLTHRHSIVAAPCAIGSSCSTSAPSMVFRLHGTHQLRLSAIAFLLIMGFLGMVWSFSSLIRDWRDAHLRLTWKYTEIQRSPRLISEMLALRFLAEPSPIDRVFSLLFGWTSYVKERAFYRKSTWLKSLRALADANNVSWYRIIPVTLRNTIDVEIRTIESALREASSRDEKEVRVEEGSAEEEREGQPRGWE